MFGSGIRGRFLPIKIPDKSTPSRGWKALLQGKVLSVDEEAGVFGDFVVEGASGGVGLMGEPVNTSAMRGIGTAIDLFDEGTTDAPAASGLKSEEILEVAVGGGHVGGAVEDVVDEAEELAIALSDQGVHRLVVVEEAGPGETGGFVGKGCWTGAAVEGVVSVPEELPLGEVGGDDGPDCEGGGHGLS